MKAIISAASAALSSFSNTSPDILRGRPTLTPRTHTAIQAILSKALAKTCTCEKCATGKYTETSLCAAQHARDHLLVRHGRCPDLKDPEADRWPYNAMYLANVTRRYFSRPEQQFAPQQQNAVRHCQMMLYKDKEFMQALDMEDCSKLDEAHMLELVQSLGRIFFFGEVNIDRFRWGEGNGVAVEDKPRTLWLHPKAYDKHVGSSRLAQRISEILHELTRVFLLQNACRDCIWAHKDNINPVGRGRAWHTLAMAIESAGPELLCLADIDLQRKACLIADMQDGHDHPSRHDLQIYEFADLLDMSS